MACQTTEHAIRIGGQERKISLTQLPAMRGVKLLARLGRVAGPGLALLSSGSPDKIGDAVREMFSALSEAEIEHLISELLFEGGRLETEGKMVPIKAVFAIEFSGEMLAIVDALKLALEVNFGSFFGGLAGLLPAGLLKAPPSSTSTIFAGQPKG